MKKLVLFLVFSFSFLSADYLIYGYQNNNFNSICVKSYSFNNQYLNVTLSSNNSSFSYNLSDFSSFDILPDYEYINNLCVPQIFNNSYYGMTFYDYNYAMAIYGIFLSSLIAFGLIKAF